ncbi:MAG: hypothetical protein HFG54_10025 [Lachnospiraceae bacterium]|nr:hypothetical protein [Lachnospiraceae bacterium]
MEKVPCHLRYPKNDWKEYTREESLSMVLDGKGFSMKKLTGEDPGLAPLLNALIEKGKQLTSST